jgi:hypothetical protein
MIEVGNLFICFNDNISSVITIFVLCGVTFPSGHQLNLKIQKIFDAILHKVF